VFKIPCCSFFIGTMHIHEGAVVGLRWIFFLLVFSLFSLLKYEDIFSFVFCIQFGLILFIVNCFFNFFYWSFSSISSLKIWFQIIFISNLVAIFYHYFFWIFLLYFFFNFIPWYFVNLEFYCVNKVCFICGSSKAHDQGHKFQRLL